MAGKRNSAKLVVMLFVGVIAGLLTLIPLVAKPTREVREIAVVARNMTFYVAGKAEPNPTITVRPGEQIRIVLRNDEFGVIHNFAVRSLNISSGMIRHADKSEVTFTAPDEPGDYRYDCTPHARMMQGTLRVR